MKPAPQMQYALMKRGSETPQNCHLVFTTKNAEQAKKIKSTLPVSDNEDFAIEGGIIEMVEQDGKIKLRGNLKAAENAGFKINSRLLHIMDVIR